MVFPGNPSKTEPKRTEPEKGGLLQMIFSVFTWGVIFRFQPFVFLGPGGIYVLKTIVVYSISLDRYHNTTIILLA